jgi:hypothetical protein
MHRGSFRPVTPFNNARFHNSFFPSTRSLNNFIALNNFLVAKPFTDQQVTNRAFSNLVATSPKFNINNFAQLPRNPIVNTIQPAAGSTGIINTSANPYWPYVNPWRTVPTGWNWPYSYPYSSYPYWYPASYSYGGGYSPGYSGGLGSYSGGLGSYGGSYGGAPASYGSSNYGGAVPAYNPYTDLAPAAPADNKANAVPTLTAYAVPNEGGRVTWPLAFRLTNPDQKKEMLDKLEAQLQIVATQAAAGQANPRLLDQAAQSVEKMHQWLRARRDQMADGTFRDGEAFLRKLETALKAMGG